MTRPETTLDHPTSSAEADLRHLVEHAAHLLPAQGPIEVFVHHNTLHAYQDLTFHEAVKAGQERYGANPYLSENEYRQHLANGRITHADLAAVIEADLGERTHEPIDGLGTRGEIRLAMLLHPLHVGPDAELRWILAETDALDRFRPEVFKHSRERIIAGSRKWLESSPNLDDQQFAELNVVLAKFGGENANWQDSAWETFSLHLLWNICREGVGTYRSTPLANTFLHPRHILWQAYGTDINREVHDILIRFCAAYVDQGYSDWSLPNRELGFYESFLALYSQSGLTSGHWLRGLQKELATLQREGVSASQSILDSLEQLGIAEADREEFIVQTLMSLRGWAGMVWQLESGVDWVVHPIPKGSLLGLLAVQLILERHAIGHAGKEQSGRKQSASEVIQQARQHLSPPSTLSVDRRAFLLFQVAQMQGWTPQLLQSLSEAEWHELALEIEQFNGIERRRTYHEAYERQYRNHALDAFALHSQQRHETEPTTPQSRPCFQIVTCIDDREESFRRHLEEVEPRCETFGAAGFFAVAMYYRGAADGFYKPLCPGVITPDHYVQEDVGYTFEGVHRSRAEIRKRLGQATHLFHTRSRTFLGGVVAGIVGSLATAPLVARVLFPHLTARIRKRFGALLQPPQVTQLQLERYDETPGPENGHIGFSTDEMANAVLRLLQDMGVTTPEAFSRLFIVCGHGSSSLNNPHESAYCCGACAGKRGGPNARAFSEMANDWRVRAKVAELGIAIPDDTMFVGAYHNTCDDSVVFFDLDRLPASHRPDFETAREAIEIARQRNAHERCRRFDSAAFSLSPTEALRHVEARAQDISQARPEYNHATNALCVVGQRDRTRGLFLDRRAFLTSYDSTLDDAESSILARILAAAIPVCAGINLEYYFSCVDYTVYGSGSKLPHNIVSLLGVMEGTSSDLRTGLYQQMVEIHEALRITFVIETAPAAMLSIMDRNPTIGTLVRGEWCHLAVIDPATSETHLYQKGEFVPHRVQDANLKTVDSSLECYDGLRDHLPFFSIHETATTTTEAVR